MMNIDIETCLNNKIHSVLDIHAQITGLAESPIPHGGFG